MEDKKNSYDTLKSLLIYLVFMTGIILSVLLIIILSLFRFRTDHSLTWVDFISLKWDQLLTRENILITLLFLFFIYAYAWLKINKK